MKKLIFILFLLGFTSAQSQDVVTQSLYWIRYQNQLIISPKWYWNNEIDNRRFFDPDVENQLIFHSRLHYKRGKWDFASGLTFSWIFAQKPENGFDYAVAEVRPVAEVSHEQPLGKVFFLNRLRIDNRFFQENQEESVWEESFYILRIRYRAQVRIPLKINAEKVPVITLRIADEIMFNNKENTFDQNRIYVTGDFYLNKKLSLEAGYIYIYQHRLGLDEFFSRHVVRFSVMHRISMY